MAAQEIKSLKLTNFTEVYSLTNEKKYDVDNLTQRHLLWKQFERGTAMDQVLHHLSII